MSRVSEEMETENIHLNLREDKCYRNLEEFEISPLAVARACRVYTRDQNCTTASDNTRSLTDRPPVNSYQTFIF